jgi:hypothetical protein
VAETGGIREISYFRWPKYIQQHDGKKPLKIVQFSTAQLLSAVFPFNFWQP